MSDSRPFAFVMMPFDSAFDDVYKLGIQDVATSVGFRAERLDEQIFVEGMMARLYQQIEEADVIIADLSRKSANVFYEVGFADGKDKLCILLTSDASDIPFDFKHRRHIVYTSISMLRERLRKDLEWARAEISHRRSETLHIEQNVRAVELKTGVYALEGTVTITADLFNLSARRGIVIHALYLYLDGSEWRLSQHGKECPWTRSDLKEFRHRYLVAVPVTQLHKGGWVQLKVDGTKVLASRWSGDPPPQAFLCDDAFLLRVATDSGDRDFRLDVVADFNTINPGSGE